MNKVDIADLDVIYLTYDEPQKEEFWIKIKNMLPWAKRVDGVKGSDSAHKAAAAASGTERFILIDGDNIPDLNFFNLSMEFPSPKWEQAVYRWRAKNHINGLVYGNGGISSWTRTYIENMRTHENSAGDNQTAVEFCFDNLYWSMHDCYSTTYPNHSPFQAWRAGFREGVKMCLDRGRRPTLAEFQDSVHRRNLDHLCVWQSVGSDVENGTWAIYGARLGTYLTMLTEWDYTEVKDFDKLYKLWQQFEQYPPKDLLGQLKSRLNLPIVDLSADQSKFFKSHYYTNWSNLGLMIRECDIK